MVGYYTIKALMQTWGQAMVGRNWNGPPTSKQHICKPHKESILNTSTLDPDEFSDVTGLTSQLYLLKETKAWTIQLNTYRSLAQGHQEVRQKCLQLR